ncbi:MAG: lipopolysaccharide biosynthesis protein [Candidatus Hadarchaeum sp.]
MRSLNPKTDPLSPTTSFSQLRKVSLRGGVVTIIAQSCKLILQLVSTAILARLLGPEEYGLIAMALAVTSFVNLFKDLGLSTATIQQDTISHQQISNLFWLNALAGMLVAILTCALAPALAIFYGESRLTAIMIALALGFLISGFAVQHQALMRRQMRFVALAAIDVGSMLVAILVAVLMAVSGWGYWALVLQMICQNVVYLGMLWWLARWWPDRPRRNAGIRSLLVYGGNLTGFEILAHIGRSVTPILLGRYYGPEQVGYFGRAYNLLLIPYSQITGALNTVVVPALSRCTSDPVHYRHVVSSLLEKILIVSLPLLIPLIVAADWVVLIFLGQRWMNVAPVFSWLGLYVFGHPVAVVAVWILMTQGRADVLFRWGILDTALVILATLVGIKAGAVGIAAAFALVSLFVRLPILVLAVDRYSFVKARDMIRSSGSYLLLGVFLYLCLVLTKPWLQHLLTPYPWQGLCFLVTISCVIFFALAWAIPSQRKTFLSLYHLLRSLRPGE